MVTGSKTCVDSRKRITQPSRIKKGTRTGRPRKSATALPVPLSQISAICKVRREQDELSYLDFVNETIKHSLSMHIQTIYDKMADEYVHSRATKQEIYLNTVALSDRTALPENLAPNGEVMKIKPELSPTAPSRVKLEKVQVKLEKE